MQIWQIRVDLVDRVIELRLHGSPWFVCVLARANRGLRSQAWVPSKNILVALFLETNHPLGVPAIEHVDSMTRSNSVTKE